jgi:serine/threonine-protein kinase
MRTLGDIQPGQTLGRYEFLVPIAQGGMAAVWAARLKGSRGFSKTVAVKTMLPLVSDDPAFEQMFLDEAQIASRIRHPNVVEILDLGEQDDVLYLVMEWVDGEPLSTLRHVAAKRGGIPRPIAVRIVADACAGLHAAHELRAEDGSLVGLVHRDISPQNILITFDGVIKIVDFGVAKAAGRSSESTSAGHIKGKPPYMSPEQALGHPIDRRSDLFALGIVLYQLTTGKHPFRGETDIITLQNIVSERPIVSPRTYDPECPKPLEAVLFKALERDPDKRYQTAAEFGAALERVFPPTVPRVRTDDVGKLVMQLLGDIADERRSALRDAIRDADARAAGADLSGPHPGVDQLATVIGELPSSPSHGRTVDAALTVSPGTPYGTQSPSAPPPSLAPRARGALWIVGGIAAATLAIGSAVVFTSGAAEQAENARAAAPAGAAPTSVATAIPEAAAAEAPAAEAPAAEAPAAEPPITALTGAVDVDVESVTPVPEPPARPTAVVRPRPVAPAKPRKTETPAKHTSSGFVPPPVTDPGF